MWIQKLPSGSVTALAYSPDGRTLYTGSTTGRVFAWNLATRTHTELYRRATGSSGVYYLWPTPTGRLLIREGRTLLDALAPASGPLIVPGPDDWGDWRYVLPDGLRAISCEPEWRIGLWDVETGQRLPVPGPLGDALHITHHELLPDGVTFLTFDSNSNALALWNFRTGEPLGALTPNHQYISPSVLAPDGTTFAVGRNKMLWVYDVPTRSLRHRLAFEKEFRALAFHPNSRYLASAATDSVLTLWDVFGGTEVQRYDWSIGKIQNVAFSPDGLTCAVGGSNKQFAVFDVDV